MSTTNWNVVMDDNMAAIQSFVDGASLRSTIKQFNCEEARRELYALEKHVPVSTARQRARRALARRS